MLFLKYLPNMFNPGFWKKTYQELQLVWHVIQDERVPVYLKLIPAFVAAYLLSPFDLIPGFLPVVGQLDDIGLLLLTLKMFVNLTPNEIVAQYKQQLGLQRVELSSGD